MSERGEDLKFVSECSTESLVAVFDPAYASRLNCGLADHVLRLMIADLSRRGQELTPAMRDYLVGDAFCEHGRSTSGTCGKCDVALHPRLAAVKAGAKGFAKQRYWEVLCEVTNELLGADHKQYHLVEGDWECPDPEEKERPGQVRSPTGHCVYSQKAGENCLFCGNPQERK